MAKTKTRTKTGTSKTIFYSWQSDSPGKTNLNAIRGALKRACKTLEAVDPTLKLVADEATRDTSGSPNIALKILEKIEAADIFVADVTTVTPPGADRPCPNPNVGYELGYAVAMLGWERVILLFNDQIGNFPADLPFDFVQNRASPYSFAETDPHSKGNDLAAFLEVAINAVIEKDPKRPAELKGLTPEKLRHDHDVENMRWLMRAIHLPTLQDHIEQLPHAISNRAIWFYETFRGVAANALFSVYDPMLSAAVDKLHRGWVAAMAHDNQYHDTPSGKMHVFSNAGDLPLEGERQDAWDAIDAARRDMADAITTMLDRLRSDYLEIKINKTNKRAWADYIADHRDENELLRKLKRRKKKARK